MSINKYSQSLASTRLYEQETSLEFLAERHGLEQSNMIDFSLNVNPFGCSAGAIDAISLSLGQVQLYPDTIFVVDEALINPIKEGAIGLVDRFDNVAILRTFSKFFGLAGMRVGYAIANQKLIDIANIGRPPFNVSLPAAVAAIAALQDENFLRQCSEKFLEESTYFRA